MKNPSPLRRLERHAAAVLLAMLAVVTQAPAAAGESPPPYSPIAATRTNKTIALNGHHLTIDQIVAVARHGARVELSSEARERQVDNYGLLLEATGESVLRVLVQPRDRRSARDGAVQRRCHLRCQSRLCRAARHWRHSARARWPASGRKSAEERSPAR